MEISLIGAGKKFYREWIFRNTNLTFSGKQKTVILGPNGSGKSTLIQVLAGSSLLTEGTLAYASGGKSIDADSIFRQISFAAPYLELIEEFTLKEIIAFHMKLKPSLNDLTLSEILQLSGLADKSDSIFKFFSSGMKQRIKLLLAIVSDTPVLFLDEPCSNLDTTGVNWYREMINRFSKDRMVIVASNQHEEEYFFCTAQVKMSDLK